MNKKTVIALIALLAVVGLMAGIWFAARPQETPQGTDPGGSAPEYLYSFTVIVIHADGTEKTFQYQTNETHLGPVLKAEGLIEESSSPGLYDKVDGELADWNKDQSWWGFYIGEESAMQGMDDTLITDGAVYKLVYTK